ncbi:hypothetical protein HDU76_011093, partial [Blyttiomyces sp. JEL0837]
MLTNCWLKQTEAWVMAAKVLRQSIQVKKAIQMDGTYKYAKKVKVNIDGTNHSADETTVLYIAMNEIGQVIDWSWMKAESRDQIRPFLQNIVRNHVGTQEQRQLLLTSTSSSSNMISGHHDIVEYDDETEDFDEHEDGNQERGEEATEIEDAHEEDQLEDSNESRQIVVVVDNAFLIERLLEDMDGCCIGQDPNHLMRQTSKCIDKDYLKMGFSQTYRKTIFHSNGQLVNQKQMFLDVRELFLSVPSESIINQKKFHGVFLRTLKHIQRGHLIPPNDNNIHSENGYDRRVLTESPLEGLNTEIRDIMPAKDIGLQVADRVLELNFMLINLRQGEKFGRIPPLNHCNL